MSLGPNAAAFLLPYSCLMGGGCWLLQLNTLAREVHWARVSGCPIVSDLLLRESQYMSRGIRRYILSQRSHFPHHQTVGHLPRDIRLNLVLYCVRSFAAFPRPAASTSLRLCPVRFPREVRQASLRPRALLIALCLPILPRLALAGRFIRQRPSSLCWRMTSLQITMIVSSIAGLTSGRS